MAFNSNNFKTLEFDYEITELDPDTIVKSGLFPSNFKVRIVMEEVPASQASQEELKLQRQGRDTILEILKLREADAITSSDTQTLVFGDPDFDDRDEAMVVGLDQKPQSDSSENED